MSFIHSVCTRGHAYSYPGENDDPGCFDCDREERLLIQALMDEAHNVAQTVRVPKLEATLLALREWFDD